MQCLIVKKPLVRRGHSRCLGRNHKKLKQKKREKVLQQIRNAGYNPAEALEKAQQYIKRKATKDFQESKAAYQAALDEVMADAGQKRKNHL